MGMSFRPSPIKAVHVKIAPSLKPIFDLELSLGNTVKRIDEPAGTESPFAVVFDQKLHLKEIHKLHLPKSVSYWECRDPHYETEGGYKCRISKHIVSGPLT